MQMLRKQVQHKDLISATGNGNDWTSTLSHGSAIICALDDDDYDDTKPTVDRVSTPPPNDPTIHDQSTPEFRRQLNALQQYARDDWFVRADAFINH